MKLSSEIGSAARLIGEEHAIALLGEAGFDAWDFSMMRVVRRYGPNNLPALEDHPLLTPTYLSYAKELRRIGESYGMTCNQAHAPFPVRFPEIRALLPRALEAAAAAGAPLCVVHPDNYKSAEENAEMFAELLPYAKDLGIRIAVENMWLWDKENDRARAAACSSPADFLAHIEAVGDPYLCACLDIGHAEMMGAEVSAVKMIHTLGSHLAALHLHDNDRRHDRHLLPFAGEIDFPPIMRALRDIGYTGDFTLEADTYLPSLAREDWAAGARDLHKAALRLRNMWEETYS